MGKLGRQAVVLGASMAGLAAARVLADAYESVTVVDRDGRQGVDTPRRGVPQGAHAHGVLAAGQHAVERLFPGLTDRLRSDGVPICDLGQARWFVDGNRLRPAETGLQLLGIARPALEDYVQERVAEMPNVTFRGDTDIVGPVMSRDGRSVIGAEVAPRGRGDAGSERLDADLVVDASGRGSRTPALLVAAGYPDVEVERIKVDITYTSRRYRLRHDPFRGDQTINLIATPAHPRGAFLHTLGGDRCLLSLTGIAGDVPPTDDAGLLEYARSLPVPDVYNALVDAHPLTAATSFRFPMSQRRRYERLSRFPGRFLVLGDAVCSFNPVYGQGMSVAWLEALVLQDHLAALSPGGAPDPHSFFSDIARVVDGPWETAATGDLAFPGVQGRRSLKVRLGNAYMPLVQRAATHDPRITDTFLRVAGLIEPPESLMRPATLLRVLRHGLGPAAEPVPAGTPLPVARAA